MRHATVFTGHRIDAPDRPEPRFPADLAPVAARAIAARLRPGRAVSSASNGADILFIEACCAAHVPCDIVLPFPAAEFVGRSVRSDAPGDWQARFRAIWRETPAERRHVLPASPEQNPYDACNDAILKIARDTGLPCRLVALWDGKGGDGAGGTAGMVRKARASGMEVEIIAPGKLQSDRR